MDKENLERMAKKYKDPVYSRIISYREFEKMASTYGCKDPDNPHGGWWPGGDGCVHPDFGFAPATGQSNSTDPNAQNYPNISKYGTLAEQFAECIEAQPGKVWIEFDWKSFHARTLGWEAEDWGYYRLAALDIHSYLASFISQLPDRWKALQWDDDKLRAWLKKIKTEHEKVRNKQAKPAILGYGFGMGANRLFSMNRESFKNQHEAEGVFQALDAAFVQACGFRKRIPEVAHERKNLTTSFGGIRWFWCVKTWDIRERHWTHGEDWEKAIAYMPAADAFGHKKVVMREIYANGWDEKYGLCNDVHDALKFHCDAKYREECIGNIGELMQRPSGILVKPDGRKFSCEVDVKVGQNWRDMEDFKRAA